MSATSEPEILEKIHKLSGREFEEFVASLWSLQGWETMVTDTAADNGRDILAERKMPFRVSIKIETKRWKDVNVSGPQIRKYALLPGDDADYAVVVTSSGFSEPAKQTAKRNNVKLIDGITLTNLVEKLDAKGLLAEEVDVSDWEQVKSECYIDWSVGVPGQGERITVISGIGATYAERLNKAGIHTVGDLIAVDPERVAGQTGLSRSHIERWSNLATFHEKGERVGVIEGIGREEVEQLAEADIYTGDDLMDASAQEVAAKTNLQERTLKQWIGDAARRDVTLVTDLPDIGEVRGEQLASVGIFTEKDLADASPERVANATKLAEHQVEKWVELASI